MWRFAAILAVILCVRPALAADALTAAQSAERCDDVEGALAGAAQGLAQKGLSFGDAAHLHALRAFALIAQGEDARDDIRAASADKAFLSAALAHGYSLRGNAMLKAQNWDLAEASFGKAIGFDPKRKSAYAGRGMAEVANTETEQAIADYDKALALGPTADIYRHRGEAREEDLDFAGAIADYGAAVQLDPKYADGFGLRGRAFAVLGRYEFARADLERALALSPGAVTSVVWLHIVHLRTHQDDRAWIAARLPHLNINTWPGPVLAYFAGQIPADDMTQIALKSADTARFHQRCDSWFYLGEEAAARGDTDKARDLFRQTIGHCNAVDYEWDAARMELKRLPS